jgi:pimeloyl-ACP methyl ester carboxylesterase
MDYERLSETPGEFERFVADVGLMQRTQPELTSAEVAGVRVPFLEAQGRGDEFIRPEHAEYLAGTVPGAELMWLEGVTHFAPLQRPEVFVEAVLKLMEIVDRDHRARHAKQ